MKMVKAVCLTENHPNGQFFSAVRLVYDGEVDEKSLSPDAFEVEGQKVTQVSAKGCEIVLKIDTSRDSAEVFRHPRFDGPPEGHGPHGGPGRHGGPRGPMGPGGPGGQQEDRLKPVQLTVAQKKDIAGQDGSVLPAGDERIVTDSTEEPVVEEFVPGTFNGISYSLFSPKNLEEGKKVPLVVFVPDDSINGSGPRLTLAQGNGAVTWAEPSWQEKHPCYVLAPMTSGMKFMDDVNESDTPGLYILKGLIDFIAFNNPVDENRIYCTGQSGGGMCFLEMNILYPDYFAAALFVGCQWNAERIGRACAHKKFWALVSENDGRAFPGWNAMTEELEKNGAKVGRHHWNAKSPQEELEREAAQAAKEDVNIHYTVFDGDSVVPDGIEPKSVTNHMNTWPAAYRIDGVKEWIFAQSNEK